MFEPDVCLLRRDAAERLKASEDAPTDEELEDAFGGTSQPPVDETSSEDEAASKQPSPEATPRAARLSVRGEIPPEAWNRVGTRLLPKLRTESVRDLRASVALEARTDGIGAEALASELRQALEDLNLADGVRVEVGEE